MFLWGVLMKKKAIIFFIVLVIAVILVFAFNTRLKTVTYNVKSSKINSEIKLALVTDLHSCYYGENQSELVTEIEKYQPDAVLLGGDIFDDVFAFCLDIHRLKILSEESIRVDADRIAYPLIPDCDAIPSIRYSSL